MEPPNGVRLVDPLETSYTALKALASLAVSEHVQFMSEIILHRQLWFIEHLDREVVNQDFLKTDDRSLVVLGEAGMGKSTLLQSLKNEDGFVVCTARKLINTQEPVSLVGDAKTLVVDALDEVSARREGDAVDRVLQRLDQLKLPRFILSCRVADWRSASALEGFADFYDEAPLELHLAPFDKEDAYVFLTARLPVTQAEQTIDHLESQGLADLWRNPQTLEMVAKVVENGTMPESRGKLFEEATKLLRIEHRRARSGAPLANLSEERVLDAAGAAFATLILTGKEAISRISLLGQEDVSLGEISNLPDAADIEDVIASRLFEACAPERFTYTHRAIGEFLGARWLARQTDTRRKRRRLLQLFKSNALVPSSLRGLHAWLAWHSTELADQVIASDPMGVLEYGDTDQLSEVQGRTLFHALSRLSEENPRFAGWSQYQARGLAQRSLLPQIQDAITSASVEFRFRLLLLQVFKGSSLLPAIRENLFQLLFDPTAAYALRAEAAFRLLELQDGTEFSDVIRRLVDQAKEDCTRLASELLRKIGYEHFDDELILDTVWAQLGTSNLVGVFFDLKRNLPVDRIVPLLDGLGTRVASVDARLGFQDADTLADLAYALIARCLKNSAPQPNKLWRWTQSFNPRRGLRRDSRKEIADVFSSNSELRRNMQRYILSELESDKDVWQRAWEMRSLGMAPNEEDLLWLLGEIDQDDTRWQEIVQLVPHSHEAGAAIRAAARRFTRPNSDDDTWLDGLATPKVPDWQIEQDRQDREAKAQRQEEWQKHREAYSKDIDALRTGEFGALLNPAMAYLNLLHEIGDDDTDGVDRLETWLGPDLKDAALAGFEAFLNTEPAVPTAEQIAQSYAEKRHWNAAFILVAALAERNRTGRGFDDLPAERLMAGYIELKTNIIGRDAGLPSLNADLERELRARKFWEETQRLLIEPQLASRSDYINGLYELIGSDIDAGLSTLLCDDWLTRFPDMSVKAEEVIVDKLLTNPAGVFALRDQLPRRIELDISGERRLLWIAIGLILDFENAVKRLEHDDLSGTDLFWAIRERTSQKNRTKLAVPLDAGLLGWTIATFRGTFSFSRPPRGVYSGDTNSWDANEFLVEFINRLADSNAEEAGIILEELRNAPADGYTDHIKIAFAEHHRKRAEAEWSAPALSAVVSAITDKAPTTSAQLQAVMLEELDEVQAKIRGTSLDWYKDFFSEGVPKNEDACRDTILKMFGELPFGIQASPEGHLADDKRCDIECTLPGIMVPIELKGQWHSELWTAADRQLDLLYTNDWRAERGIYVVLWFGLEADKKPRNPPSGVPHPTSADELRQALATQSVSARDGRTAIVVLDVTRPS